MLKHYFKKAVRKEVFLGNDKIDKVDSFRFFQNFYDNAIKRDKATISSFPQSGLIPLNPEVV
jgi:hypothetical protein